MDNHHQDWDLLAVVRSCSSTTTTTTTTTTSIPSSGLRLSPPPPAAQSQTLPPPLLSQQEQLCFSPTPSTCSSSSVLFGFSTPLPATSFLSGGQQEMLDICQPLSCTTSTVNNLKSFSCSSMNSPVSSSSSLLEGGRSFMVGQEQQEHHQQQPRRLIKPSHVIFGASGGATSQSKKIKRRKNMMKKVCHIPAEGLSSDMWAWRKYGQKPIKGSPHPRGYYRCSSSKGCLARKQVEKNRSNPKMLIVTYTSEHNHPMPTHRNSLAGSTRQKPLTSTDTQPDQPTCSSPSLSPLAETLKSKTEGENLIKDEGDNDMGGLSDLMLNDDFYVGFEQIDGGSDDSDCFSEQFSPSSELLWSGNGGEG